MKAKLMHEETGRELREGDRATTRHGEEVVVMGFTPPSRLSSYGRVYLLYLDGFKREVYPGVIDARIVPDATE